MPFQWESNALIAGVRCRLTGSEMPWKNRESDAVKSGGDEVGVRCRVNIHGLRSNIGSQMPCNKEKLTINKHLR